jgi:hypothetical protein
MKTVLVLGDCQSNGNNCLAHQIFDDPTRLQTWSLRYHQQAAIVSTWFKEKHPEFKPNLDLEIWKFLRQQELAIAWPNLLQRAQVTNLSINGAHFIGHHSRLKKYIDQNNIPDHVIITDYAPSHQVCAFKHNSQYVTELTFSPMPAHDEFIKNKIRGRFKYQDQQSSDWHWRRHQKSFRMLMQCVNHYKIPYTVVVFGGHEIDLHRFMSADVDCTDIHNEYHPHTKSLWEQGEHSKNKFESQQIIADRVQTALDR